jgi:hypothetical protein
MKHQNIQSTKIQEMDKHESESTIRRGQQAPIISMVTGLTSEQLCHITRLPLGYLQNETVGDNQRNHLVKVAQQAASVLESVDPLVLVEKAIRKLGYGGDLKPPLIAYLAATSRLLWMRSGTMPVHLLLVGQPGAGKSYTLGVVIKLLPSEAVHRIEAGSPRVLIYDAVPIRHKVLIFSEADSLPAGEDNPAASAIRSLLQDH